MINKDNIRRILVFNKLKRLIAVFQSITAAANTFNTSPTNIYYACNGKNISSRNFYFRHLYDDKVEIDLLNDLGKLKLEEYDDFVGIERKYYKRNMSRKGMKYNKQQQQYKQQQQ